jgi:AcrR family transcriptional regulator
MDMNRSRRSYDMSTRAPAAEATRSGILRTALELVGEKPTLEVVLADVAAGAGVTVKTVLRHFGSREGLFDALWEFGRREIAEERETPVGDTDAALRVIVDHYERRGDWVTGLLAQEASDPRIAAFAAEGRRTHRNWVETVFAPQLEDRATRDEAVDLLVVATDVSTWKLLRRDRGLDRATVQRRMRRLVSAVLASEEEP